MAEFEPGQMLRCTITTRPRREAHVKTIQRLMRQDTDVQRSLKRAQRLRRQETPSKIRGGRVWYNRPPVGKIVRVTEGESWTMPWVPQIEADLESVSGFIRVEQA